MASPRHVMITGASGGLGAALARHYARARCRLSLFGRDAERLERTALECRDGGGGVVNTFRCDLRDAGETDRLVQAADAGAQVDVLIANAGIGGAGALAGAAGETIEQARALVETNLMGVLNTVTPLLSSMTVRRSGQVVLIGSIAGLIGLPQSPVYCAAKSAVHLYGEGLGRRLRGSGVGVTVVCPGFVDTPMSASLPTARPFLWSADRAAAHIAAAIDRRQSLVIFPWQLRMAAAASRLLPRAVVDRVLSSAQTGVSL
jgi:short-subunit dehydrogenase